MMIIYEDSLLNEPIPKATILSIVGNFQNRFHDLELDWLFKIQGSKSKF